MTVAWQPTPGLSAGLTGLLARDIGSALARQMVGPELAFPRLFGPRGGLSLGYLEELGWLRGRSAYAQTVLQPASSLRLLGRVSWFQERPPPEVTDMLSTHEMGLFASAEYAPARWLSLRLSALARFHPASFSEESSRSPVEGLVGQASLAGSF
jgi:hypothetical protein